MDIQFLIDAITEELKKGANANLYKERGRLRMQAGDKAGAMEDLRQAVQLDPTILSGIDGEFKNK